MSIPVLLCRADAERAWQAWIRLSLRREVASKAADLGSLLEGQASAYVHVHSAAMLALVAEAGPLKADVCPETLLLDVGRLGGLQREVQYVVVAATMLATATHRLTATRNATDVQVGLSSLSFKLLSSVSHSFSLALFVSFPLYPSISIHPSIEVSLSLSKTLLISPRLRLFCSIV